MMMKKVVLTTTTMMMSLYGRTMITLVQMLFTKIGFYKEILVRKISDICYNVNKSSLTTRSQLYFKSVNRISVILNIFSIGSCQW